MIKDRFAVYHYTNMAPCIVQKKRVVDVSVSGDWTKITYDNGREMIVREDVYKVRNDIYGDDELFGSTSLDGTEGQ